MAKATTARRAAPDQRFLPVTRREDIPHFQDEHEEAAYWATHDLAGALLAEMEAVPLEGDSELPPARSPAPRTRPIAVRLDEDVLRRLKALATKHHKGYQALVKEFIVERLHEEEQRAAAPPGAAMVGGPR